MAAARRRQPASSLLTPGKPWKRKYPRVTRGLIPAAAIKSHLPARKNMPKPGIKNNPGKGRPVLTGRRSGERTPGKAA
ncbi:hypothetical protein MTHERMOG20_12240 [Moorella thermoacetica]|nr:hypothetical protein MTHERMOG20_12240 [Moorella thermoacetica]